MRILYLIFFLTLLLISYSAISQTNNCWEKIPFNIDRAASFFYTDLYDSSLYVVGEFSTVDGKPGNVIKLKDDTFSVLPSVPMLTINTMIRYKGILYVAGWGGLMKLDELGQKWIYIDSPDRFRNSATIFTIEHYRGKLILGGRFTKIAGNSIPSVALFDGEHFEDFHRIDTVLGDNPAITSIAEYKGNLYFAGNIDPQETPKIKEIAMWDGKSWRDVGGGLKGDGLSGVNMLKVWDNELYVAGIFDETTNAPGNGIARWNGVRWKSVGPGLQQNNYPGGATAMIEYNGKLCVTGAFFQVGDLVATNLACWDGRSWSSLGHFDKPTFALASYNGDLYIGGGFRQVNQDTTIKFIAKYSCGNKVDSTSAFVDTSHIAEEYILYPNPASGKVYLNIAGVEMVKIYAADGRHVRTATADEVPNGINVEGLAAGMYFAKIFAKEAIFRAKFLKL